MGIRDERAAHTVGLARFTPVTLRKAGLVRLRQICRKTPLQPFRFAFVVIAEFSQRLLHGPIRG